MAVQKFKATGSSTLTPIDNIKRMEVAVPPFFDEQIQFVNAKGAFLVRVKYTVCLEDGSTWEGITDSAGRTERIRTAAPLGIELATLRSVKPLHTCSQHPDLVAEPLEIALLNIKTNSIGIGKSVVNVKTPEGKTRGLTAGEIEMAQLIFKDSIDYSKVKCHNGEYLWFGMQPDSTAMTPEGEIYFNPKEFREDFSKEPFESRIWFMHEMVHVWQYQLGYPTKLRGALRVGLWYEYTLRDGKRLSDYNMEAQGDILADYWALLDAKSKGKLPPFINQRKHIKDLPLYEIVLRHFIDDPSSTLSLPS